MELQDPTFSDEVTRAVLPDVVPDNLLFTVGCVLRGDDAVGPYVAKLFKEDEIDGWMLVEGDQTPENELGYLRRLHPKRIVMIDAADMGLDAGEVRLIKAEDVKTSFLFTTHSMPITYLLGQLEDACDELVFIGVQPAQTEFFAPLTDAVRESAKTIYRSLLEDDFSEISPLS